jgi:OOP family OmpA-OmpF porin
LSLLAVLMQEAGLTVLEEATPDQPVTLFAPTDDAFDALPADAFAKLRADPEILRRVLGHHAVAGALLAPDLAAGPLEALDGGSLQIGRDGATMTVSGAIVVGPDITAANGVVHVIDTVLVPDDVDITVAGRFAATSATLQDEAVTLSGVVASEVERAVLLQAAAGPDGSVAVDDQLTVDPDIGIDDATTVSLAELVAVMRTNLLSGVCGFDGTGLYVSGIYLNDAGRDAVLAVAEGLSAATELAPPPAATTTDATDLETELNAYVAANPILFQSGSSLLTESSMSVLDQVAIELLRFAGVAVTVEGHTDSDGNPAENVTLSQYRALVVRQALIDRGIDADAITAQGFGSERPILVDGVEDKLASRRVEFRVVPTS